jgi:hypothetical protein
MERRLIRSRVHPRTKLRPDAPPDPSILVVAEQTQDAITHRRAIRETFHDLQAVTIKKSNRIRRPVD